MFCTKCGQQLAEGSAFCNHCGQPVHKPDQQPQQPYQPVQQPNPNAQHYQQLYQGVPTGYTPVVQQPELSMKWFKFLIYFALFAGAVLNIINGLNMLSGAQYDGQADLVYAFYKDLKGFDIFMGLFALALGAFGIFTRFRLSGYKENGPLMLTILYIAVVIFDLVYVFGIQSVLPDYTLEYIDLSGTYGGLVGSIAIAIINYQYFKKRKHLFVN